VRAVCNDRLFIDAFNWAVARCSGVVVLREEGESVAEACAKDEGVDTRNDLRSLKSALGYKLLLRATNRPIDELYLAVNDVLVWADGKEPLDFANDGCVCRHTSEM